MRPVFHIAWDWAVRCFGMEHMTNPKERALRLLEEALELAQACGVPPSDCVKCVNMVYNRPVGDAHQEMGGVLMAAYMFMVGVKEDPDEMFLRELRRVLGKPTEHFTKRNEEKLHLLGKVPVAPHDSVWDMPKCDHTNIVHRIAGREEDCDDNEEGA